jgi:hypothetical protein
MDPLYQLEPGTPGRLGKLDARRAIPNSNDGPQDTVCTQFSQDLPPAKHSGPSESFASTRAIDIVNEPDDLITASKP